jgi:hypothetical protein
VDHFVGKKRFENSKVMKNKPKRVFRPPSAMKGIGYFQNLRIFFRNCLEFFGNFLGGFFWRNFFGGFFWEDLLGGILWEELLSRNYLVEIT